MKKILSSLGFIIYPVFLVFLLAGGTSFLAQETDKKPKLTNDAKLARLHSLRILDEMEDILEKYYYDPNFRGIDLKTRIEAAKERVKTLEYNWQMYRVLVQVLMDFNDSHTNMILPPRRDYFQYGFGVQMIGDDCIITSIKKDSDAAKQGIAVGDRIVAFGKLKPTRRDLWKMMYVLYKLDPADTLDLKIQKPDGILRSLTIKAKTMTDKEFRAEQKSRREKNKYEPVKCQPLSEEVIACKLYSFVVERSDIDKMMKQAAKYPKMILDLRGNGGGYVSIEEYLVSHFFDRQIKIGDIVTRKKTEVRFTKPSSERFYKGEVAVLVDSDSASAAEMTARVLQLEKRAKIYGDVSSGSVMTSITVPFRSIMDGTTAAVAYINVGMSVTIADVIMSDGSRLENKGVLPDEVLMPSGTALAGKTDPVLAYAAYKFGAKLTPEQAGGMYFMVEKDEFGEDGETSESK